MEIEYEFQEERTGATMFIVIFGQCFKFFKAANWSRASLKTEKFQQLLRHVEAMFRKLVEFADFENNQEKMKRILEMTSKNGSALILDATAYCSMEIINYLLKNNININNCDTKFMTAYFENAEITKLIVDYVNPKIISYLGRSHLYDRNPENFTGSVKSAAEEYPNSIHVAVTDQECKDGCLSDCNSKLVAFYYKNGPYVQRSETNRLGQGAFGTVFRGKWHGQDAVFNILKPLGHLRQQEQSLDKSTGKYVAENFEVFIFKRCRMDLERFRNDQYPKLQDFDCQLLLFIMKECLKR